MNTPLNLVEVNCFIRKRNPITGVPIVLEVIPVSSDLNVRDWVRLYGPAYVFEPKQTPVEVIPETDNADQ